jgi:hypothetical protein
MSASDAVWWYSAGRCADVAAAGVVDVMVSGLSSDERSSRSAASLPCSDGLTARTLARPQCAVAGTD